MTAKSSVPSEQPRLDFGARHFEDFRANARIAAGETGEVARQEISGDRIGHADTNAAGERRILGQRRALRRIDRRHDVAGMMQESGALRRQRDAGWLAAKERHAEIALKVLDGGGYRRLGDVERNARLATWPESAVAMK